MGTASLQPSIKLLAGSRGDPSSSGEAQRALLFSLLSWSCSAPPRLLPGLSASQEAHERGIITSISQRRKLRSTITPQALYTRPEALLCGPRGSRNRRAVASPAGTSMLLAAQGLARRSRSRACLRHEFMPDKRVLSSESGSGPERGGSPSALAHRDVCAERVEGSGVCSQT